MKKLKVSVNHTPNPIATTIRLFKSKVMGFLQWGHSHMEKTILKNTKNKGNNSRIYESLLSDFLVCYCGENISGQ
ncbi:MAG: hypothetical protein ACPGC6_06695, partial [Flavobacteriaceae bacterium]